MSISFGLSIPFVDHLGFTLEKFEGGESELHFSPRAEHLNTFDVAHGGAVMTLLDVAMATAARSIEPLMGVVTIEMKTTFMRPSQGEPGFKLRGCGRLLHRTRTMAFTEAHIIDALGQVCAHATGTFKYVPRRAPPDPGRISTD
jgi:uncharacterized protein (TIGR00369 family)